MAGVQVMLVALLEDEPFWAEAVGAAVAEAEWRLIWHGTAEAMLADSRALKAGVIVSDINLAGSGMDGRTFVRTLRDQGIATPILMLTQFAQAHPAARAFADQADDYLVKPFDKDELIGRLAALERRGRIADPGTIKVGDLKLSPQFRVVYWGDTHIPLAEQSFRLLHCMAETTGQLVSRATLWKRGWPQWRNLDMQPEVIDTAICALRNALSGPAPKGIIRTVRGKGYLLNVGTG